MKHVLGSHQHNDLYRKYHGHDSVISGLLGECGVKLLGQRLMVRDFDRQVAEFQVRVAVMNGFTALGIPVTEAMG